MSNLFKRVIVGILGVPLIIAISYFGGIYFLIFSIIVSSLALWELYSMFERKGIYPLKYTGIIISVFFLLLMYSGRESILLIIYIVLPVISSVEIFRKVKSPLNPVILFFGIIYVTVPFMMLSELLKLSGFNIVIYTFVLIWTCDTAAYFGGRAFGKHQLSEISPKKTREGMVSGFVFTVMISLILHFMFSDKINLQDALCTGLIIGIFSQIGDLFESLIKRYCVVKDSSGLIPGHGGILDRFDSLIYVVPFIYIYFAYVK